MPEEERGAAPIDWPVPDRPKGLRDRHLAVDRCCRRGAASGRHGKNRHALLTLHDLRGSPAGREFDSFNEGFGMIFGGMGLTDSRPVRASRPCAMGHFGLSRGIEVSAERIGHVRATPVLD